MKSRDSLGVACRSFVSLAVFPLSGSHWTLPNGSSCLRHLALHLLHPRNFPISWKICTKCSLNFEFNITYTTMLMDEFKMTRKLLNGAAIPNHGDVRTLESTPSAKLSMTFKLKIIE